LGGAGLPLVVADGASGPGSPAGSVGGCPPFDAPAADATESDSDESTRLESLGVVAYAPPSPGVPSPHPATNHEAEIRAANTTPRILGVYSNVVSRGNATPAIAPGSTADALRHSDPGTVTGRLSYG
jgi:hypothetical protein